MTIATPEGVELELTLAGAGSRFVSALVDLDDPVGSCSSRRIARGRAGSVASAAALLALVSFVVVLGYDIVFEVLASGRTPGKRLNGLRVVRSGGEPVGFLTSAIRNVAAARRLPPVRLRRRRGHDPRDAQEPAARRPRGGTLVVRERRAPRSPARCAAAAPAPVAVAWDTSAVTAEEIAAVRRFLERRREIEAGARRRARRARSPRGCGRRWRARPRRPRRRGLPRAARRRKDARGGV